MVQIAGIRDAFAELQALARVTVVFAEGGVGARDVGEVGDGVDRDDDGSGGGVLRLGLLGPGGC